MSSSSKSLTTGSPKVKPIIGAKAQIQKRDHEDPKDIKLFKKNKYKHLSQIQTNFTPLDIQLHHIPWVFKTAKKDHLRGCLSFFYSAQNVDRTFVSPFFKVHPFTAIAHLNILCCDLSDQALKDLFKCLRYCSGLLSLRINFSCQNRQMTDSTIMSLSSSLKYMRNLSSFSLRFKGEQRITSQGIQILYSKIKHLKSLKVMKFHSDHLSNHCQDSDVSIFFKSLQRLEFLESLNLTINSHKETPESIFPHFELLKRLKYLNLKFDRNMDSMSDCIIGNLSQTLEALPKITHLKLDLRYSYLITSKALKSLSLSLKSLQSLEVLILDFSGCRRFNSKGVAKLFDVLESLSKLSSLTLRFADCFYIPDKELRQALKNFKRLQDLPNMSLDFSSSAQYDPITRERPYRRRMFYSYQDITNYIAGKIDFDKPYGNNILGILLSSICLLLISFLTWERLSFLMF